MLTSQNIFLTDLLEEEGRHCQSKAQESKNEAASRREPTNGGRETLPMKNPHQACPAWQEQSDTQLNLTFKNLKSASLLWTSVNGNTSPATNFNKV